MADFISISLNKLHVPKDRSREVDDDYALNIQASMVEHFQFQPIIVRKTPNGKALYTLVDGAHRCRAVELLDDGDFELNAMVVKANNHEAAMVEVATNIFRNELTALDRAMAVQIYRDAWEKKHGKIKRGGDQTVNLTVCLTDTLSEEASRGFGEACAERLGLSKSAIERASQISKNLPPDLVKSLRGSPAADNQSQLLSFARLPSSQRAKAARAIKLADGDTAKALAALNDKKPDQRSAQDKLRDTCFTAFARMTVDAQRDLLGQLTTHHFEADKKAKAIVAKKSGGGKSTSKTTSTQLKGSADE